jgi:hypothetical protein
MHAALRSLVGGVACAVCAAAAHGVEFEPAVQTGVNVDSRVLAIDGKDEDDVSGRVEPTLQLREQHDPDLTWRLRYRPGFEWYVELEDLSDNDHLVDGTFSWRAGRFTSVSGSANFSYLKTIGSRRAFVAEDTGLQAEAETDIGREALTTYQGNLGITHNFSRRLQGQLGGDWSGQRSSGGRASNSLDSYATTGSLVYTLTQRDSVGVQTSATYQNLEGSSTRFYQAQGVWSHRFDPTFSFTARWGPIWVDPDHIDLLVLQENQLRTPFGRDGLQNLVFFEYDTCPTIPNGTEVVFTDGRQQCQTLRTPLNDPGDAPDPVNFIPNRAVVDMDPGPGVIPAFLDLADEAADDLRDDTVDLRILGERPEQPGVVQKYVGSFQISKAWELWRATLNYQRTASGSTTFGSNIRTDSASLQITYQPSVRWAFIWVARATRNSNTSKSPQLFTAVDRDNLNANQLLAAQLADVPGQPSAAQLNIADPIPGVARQAGLRYGEVKDSVDVFTWQVEFLTTWSISRRLTATASLRYVDQQSTGTVFAESFDAIRASVGLRYAFEPIEMF